VRQKEKLVVGGENRKKAVKEEPCRLGLPNRDKAVGVVAGERKEKGHLDKKTYPRIDSIQRTGLFCY